MIIGIDAPDKKPVAVTGYKNKKKGDLITWVKTCLNPIAGYLSPPPIIQVVNHTMGEILICAVQRSLVLVPISDQGTTSCYWFRFYDQTNKAPEYLISDLTLGRRQQPIIEIFDYKPEEFKIRNFEGTHRIVSFNIRFSYENASLVWVNDCELGVICITGERRDNRIGLGNKKPSAHLLSYIDLNKDSIGYPEKCDLRHLSFEAKISKPFDNSGHVLGFSIFFPCILNTKTYTWKAALYFISRNSLPIWYQIELKITQDILSGTDGVLSSEYSKDNLSIKRLMIERPRVSIE